MGEPEILAIGPGPLAAGSERTLAALDEANAAALARLGPLPGEAAAVKPRRKVPAWSGWDPWEPTPGRKKDWIVWGAAILVFSFAASAMVLSLSPKPPTYKLTGNVPLRSLTVDGPSAGLSRDEMLGFGAGRFSHEVDVTVAVRSATDYLGLLPGQTPDLYSFITKQDPAKLIDAMWRVKEELAHLVDPTTGELLDDQAIIPLWSLGNGTFTAPTYLSGAVAAGDYNDFGHGSWRNGSYAVVESGDMQVRLKIDDRARGLQNNGLDKPEVNDALLFALLMSSIALALATLLQIFAYGGTVSMKLGRFGRNASSLKATQRELEALALGLDDSRLNAVAMLGQGPAASRAESDQRIFERSLALAWRMADELGSHSLSQRLSAAYIVQVERLSALVSALSIRDVDMERRTRELLEATRKRGRKS